MKVSWLSHPRAFAAILALLPLVPLVVLYARDWLYAYFQIANSETPQASVLAWELWAIAAVCWSTALVARLGSVREHRSQQ